MDYLNFTDEEKFTLVDFFLYNYDAPKDRRIAFLVQDIVNNNISKDTKRIAIDIMRSSYNSCSYLPDLIKAVVEWNLDYPPDETLFTLIDELTVPIEASANGNPNI